MSVKKISRAALDSWVNGIVQKQKVFGVVAKGDRFNFEPLKSASELRLDYDVTLTSPKKFFLPQMDVIATYEVGEKYASVLETAPFVVLGVHPYDLVAILQMDEIFTAVNYDQHYMARRNAATIVACDVQTPSKNVFAASMKTAHVESGYDVLITQIDSAYLVDAATPKGEALIASLAGEHNATDAELTLRKEIWAQNDQVLCHHRLGCKPEELPALLEKSMDHPVWKEKAEKCYSCGSCNLVCPTCYCFDVQDLPDWSLREGRRYRTWDGCMLSDFALVAGNHNFRPKREQRYRHRYYRKAKYLWDKYGQIACVGCGRCITACTTKIANPVEIYNRLLEG